MDSATVSRQNNAIKKRNKENVQPVPVVKSFIKQNVLKAAPPVQSNGKTGKTAPAKQSERRQVIGEQTTVKTATLKTSAAARKPTHSQDFKKELDAKFKKQVGEAPTASQPSKPAPGMYKGRIIESKIGSIWKSSVPARSEDQKSTATNQKSANLSTSAAGRGSKTSALNRAVKPTASSSRPPNAFSSARPPARSVPTTVRPKNATVAQGRRCGTLIAKVPVPVTDKKASRPPVKSTISQFRTNGETAEEKKAKLAEWLASKGKTLKRPAMTSTAQSTKSKISNNKPAAAPKSKVTTKPKREPDVKEEPKPAPVTPALTANHQETLKSEKRVSFIMNTTLDLLENSDLELPVDPQDGGSDGVQDIVINLCEALEALEPPSRCDDAPPLVNECNDVKDECKREDVKDEDKMMVKSEDSDDEEVLEESEESDDDDCYVKENTPPTHEASVVKYSVKTTPFLQSVKKTIEEEVCSSTSKRKSNIKDLKFLTPVRRSSRIHRQSSRLPLMLADHDPCVSSLAELVRLDDDANAYIYRRNPALLDDLPDQPRL